MSSRRDVADPASGVVRQCADMCATCIFRPGNLMHLAPGRLQDMVRTTAQSNGHIVCHSTLDTDAPAICAGYAQHPLGAARSLALRAVRSGIARLHLVKPPAKETT